MIEYRVLLLNDEIINLLECLRYDSYQMKFDKSVVTQGYYYNALSNNKYFVFGCFCDNFLIGGCYVSNLYNSLYIEQLFIKREHQNNGIGHKFLEYVLKNKCLIEDFYHNRFYYSYLDATPRAESLYKRLGYREDNYLMKKRIR